MDIKQAMTIIRNVCSNYKGSLEEHQSIQAAIRAVENELSPKKGVEEKTEETKEEKTEETKKDE